jgi:hypothetical protein
MKTPPENFGYTIYCKGRDKQGAEVLKKPVRIMIQLETKQEKANDETTLETIIHCNLYETKNHKCTATGNKETYGTCRMYTLIGEETKIEKKTRPNHRTLNKKKWTYQPGNDTFIHTPTKQEYIQLMQVLEYNNTTWIMGEYPTAESNWGKNEERTCIELRINKEGKGHIRFCHTSYLEENKSEVITTQEFYRKQGINKEYLSAINHIFKEKTPQHKNECASDFRNRKGREIFGESRKICL